MARRSLDVYLHSWLVGQLIQDEHGQLSFAYDHSWLTHPESVSLSQSLPLRPEPFSRNQCRGFFAGILPDESKRELIARNLGISARNDFVMLERLGGECAGAITFLPANEPLIEPGAHSYRTLTDAELTTILEVLPRRPLMAGDTGVRLSLAGAQDKLAVHLGAHGIAIPLGNAPSTHILKPSNTHFEGLVFNEKFCLDLVAAVGVPTAAARACTSAARSYLLVERYDRSINADGTLHRLHQEDLCQALGVPPELKYQVEGGPGLRECFHLVRAASSNPAIDLQRMLDAVICNLLIGNNDAHGKNFSLLYRGRECRLAPLYDLICTVVYPELTDSLAMTIGKATSFDALYPEHVEEFSASVGLSRALTRRRFPEIAGRVLDALPTIAQTHTITRQIQDEVTRRCEKVLHRFG